MAVEGLVYTKDHEWAKIDGDKATIGITDYAQKMLGEIIFVELPEVGRELNEHGEAAVVESTKAASDIFSPVIGKVAEVNLQLESAPNLINEDCYGAGWICKLEITDKESIEGLMDSKQYEEYVQGL